MTTACPVCTSQKTVCFIEIAATPVHQNLLCESPQAALAVTRGDIELMRCDACGFVFNRLFDPGLMSYGADYENTQTASESFSAYIDETIRHLIEERGVKGQQIVEVGCGKGHFLRRLVEYPGAQNEGIGFDPSYLGPLDNLDGRLKFERRFYGPDCTDVKPDVVICRHVIEHVEDPVGLLTSVRAAIGNNLKARVFFETPDVDWILNGQVVWDVFYEHCSIFTDVSLSAAFVRAGFKVERVTRIFGEQYLWIEAVPAEPSVPELPGECAPPAVDFGKDFAALWQGWRDYIIELKRSGPLAIWGAGAKGMTFVNMVDPDGSLIDCLVDINPAKQGRFVAGSGHAIVAPEDLAARGIQSLVLLNPNYAAEVRALLAGLGSQATLILDKRA